MRICVFGAGAIGGLIGTKLARAGEDVTLIARGPHLAAIEKDGLTLHSEGQTLVARPFATDDPRAAGPQDVVIVAVKAPGLRAVAESIQPLLGPSTAIVAALNGIPWWYFYKHGGRYDGMRLRVLDPDGRLWEKLPPERVIGCVVYPAADIVAPGTIQHTYSNRFDLGEPDGSKSERITAFAQAMIKAGFRCPIRPRIRESVWVKLWGNLAFNPICALTTATLDVVTGDPVTRAIARAMMVEAEEIASKLGIAFPIDVDARIAGAAEVGAHKVSMLVDLETGRPMEIDALLGAVVELASMTGVAAPTCELVLGLVRQRARLAGCYT
ncbi:MAG: 2-dehydropantoate 2-reductase [Acidobacteria bacterium RIFCSPLOWO2_02_FULL_68_18]|nr:MAG: 2-dehydropantoate 2-reductase [Acidobacteria bacterium RIFCSPLOWO2_02_FULL_68_18]